MPRTNLPDPPDALKGLSQKLGHLIREAIRQDGPIPFSRYMEMALYQPGLGYYSAGLHKLGAGGDFITSPELGSLFAGCLARQIGQVAEHLGTYDIVELGAGTGRMASDILGSLPANRLPERYVILDRSADLRQVQRERLAELPLELSNRVEWLDRPPESPWRGVLLANEVLDALTVERFEWTSDGARQLCVDAVSGGFGWSLRAAPPSLADRIDALRIDFPAGYRSEINIHLGSWLDSVTSSMNQGLALMVDYGYPRREYYLPQRRDGTLMCHYRHRAHDDVFFWPGLQDITAWVDFTALAEASDECGMDLEGYCTQAMFLLGCGLEQVLAAQTAGSDDAGLALNAEARQLTLPGMMGERFQVMGLGRRLDFPLSGFSLQNLSHRL
jgi:SAM-dependent MidA family methyltransferase